MIKNRKKILSLTDLAGFVWYAVVAVSMVHQGNAVRLSASGASNLGIQIPMYATAALLVLAVVLRLCYGKWQGVRRLYALTVVGVSVALAFGMTFRFDASFVLSAGLMNALNVVFAAHAAWRTGRCADAEAGYPRALLWLDGCAAYAAALVLVAQTAEIGVECLPHAAVSGLALAVWLCVAVVAAVVTAGCFVRSTALKKVAAVAYYAYSVFAVGAFFLICYYLLYTDTQMHEVVCREYMNFREFGVGGYYPYDDMMVWRALNLLLSSLLVTKAFGRR